MGSGSPTAMAPPPQAVPSPLPTLDPARASSDRWVRWTVLLSVALLLWSWSRLEGYQLADEVEYLERAQQMMESSEEFERRRLEEQAYRERAVAMGLPSFELRSTRFDLGAAIRGFGFCVPWIPLLWTMEALELPPVVSMWAARALQIALCALLLALTARLGAHAAASTLGAQHARAGACCAALLLAANPILLRYGVVPVSGVAAGVCVALALDTLLATGRRSARARGLISGAWLGLSLLMAFQVLAVLLPMLVLVFVRERRQAGLRPMLLVGLLAAVLVQSALDAVYYDRFGASLQRYFVENFGSNFAILLYRIGRALRWSGLMDLSGWIYEHMSSAVQIDRDYHRVMKSTTEEEVRTLKGAAWYLRELPRQVPWPALAALAAGILVALVRRSWVALLFTCVLVLNVLALSMKGSKDFRLWLTFLPLLGALGGLGLAAVLARGTRRGVPLARATVALLLVATLASGVHGHAQTRLRGFGSYWRAMEHVNARGAQARKSGAPPPSVASAFHWAVFMRQSRDVELVKLPFHMDSWPRLGARERALLLRSLRKLDMLVLHVPSLNDRPEIRAEVCAGFCVDAAFYDREKEAGIGPGAVLVLRRRSGAADEPLLASSEPAAPGLMPLASFQESGGGTAELLGFTYTALPGDGHGWIGYTWRGAGLARDYTVVDRVTVESSPHAWQNNHAPGWGMHPTTSWSAGQVLREGYLLVSEERPFEASGERRFLGGPWRHGELMPAQLWIAFDIYGPQGLQARLEPAAGLELSGDGLARAGGFLLPVPPGARLAGP